MRRVRHREGMHCTPGSTAQLGHEPRPSDPKQARESLGEEELEHAELALGKAGEQCSRQQEQPGQRPGSWIGVREGNEQTERGGSGIQE